MKKFLPHFVIFLLVLTGCKDEDEKELNNFLQQDNFEVPNLIGQWHWKGSSKPSAISDTIRQTNPSGGTTLISINRAEIISSITEGYEKAIVFENNRIYKEYIDRKQTFETYYRVVIVKRDPLTYRLIYFEQKESQKLYFSETLVQGSDGEQDYIHIEDDCADCFNSHSYRKIF